MRRRAVDAAGRVAGAANGTYAAAKFLRPGDTMITPLDPVIAEIIPKLPLRDAETMTPQSARDALRALAASRAAVPPPPVASAIDTEVKGAAGQLAARVYRVSDAKSPTVVFFHGGGWVAGDLETHDRQARLLAIETGAVVVSVDYRRPPETRFPGAFEDAFAAVRDVFARMAEFGGDSTRVGVAGDSAGGNLAATVAIACRDAGIKLAAQLLAYPVTDVAGNFADANENARFPSRAENAEGYFLSRAVMEWFCGHYLDDARHGSGLAGVAAARKKSCRTCAGGGLHCVVRSPARRGKGLCRRTGRRRRPHEVSSRRRPDPRLFRSRRCVGNRAGRGATRPCRFPGHAGTRCLAARKPVRGSQRHMPRMRAPTSMRGPLLAARAAAPAGASGQVVFSNRWSSRSGMKRVREA